MSLQNQQNGAPIGAANDRFARLAAAPNGHLQARCKHHLDVGRGWPSFFTFPARGIVTSLMVFLSRNAQNRDVQPSDQHLDECSESVNVATRRPAN